MSTVRLVLPTPHSAQQQVLKECRRFNVLACGRRFGKGLALNTVIPTLHGPKTMETVQVGDNIFGAHGQKVPVIYKSPVHTNLQCYKLTFDNGTTVECDEEHLWETIDRKENTLERKVRTTPDIFDGFHNKNSIHYIETFYNIFTLINIEQIPSIPTQCIQVDSPDSLFLITEACIPTHNTTLGIDRIIRPALGGYPTAWFAPEDQYFREAWNDLVKLLRPVLSYKNETNHILGLVGGGSITCWNMAHPENMARGFKYKTIVVDEVAIIPHFADAWERALRPTLIDFKGNAWFFSTPKGFQAFHTLYQKGADADARIAEALSAGETPPPEQWKSWQLPSHANPHLPPEELEELRKTLTPKAYAQEILAQFLGEGTAVFPNVMEQSIKTLQGYNGMHKYVIGVDWGRESDYTVYTVLDVTTKSVVWIEATSKIEFHHQRDRLKALAEIYHPQMILTEMNSIGVPNFEELQRMNLPVVPFWTTNASKQQLVDALVLAMSRRVLFLLNRDQYVEGTKVGQMCVDQLHAFSSSRSPTGLVKYGAPEGSHDDCVISLGLAWLACLAPDSAAFTPEQIEQSLSDTPTWLL